MAFFVLFGVLERVSGYVVLFLRLPVPFCEERKPLRGLDQDNPAEAGLNWSPLLFILKPWMDNR
jgi:hypothetical protein